jgi:hypothetical protein
MSAKKARADQSVKPETSKAETPITCTDQGDRNCVWLIILRGLTPLALLAVIVVAVLVLIMLIRFVIDPVRYFLVQELSFTIVMVTGLVLAIITYILAIRQSLRQIETWRQNGYTTKVIAGLVALALVAIITALPVILALFFSLV